MITPTLERIILSTLKESAPHLVPEGTLFTEVNVASATPVSTGLLRQALVDLSKRNQITNVDTDDGTKYRIAPEGQARLVEGNCW